MNDAELEEILHWWPIVLRRVMADGSDDWIKGFAKSIARHAKRPRWRPTQKQAQIMRQLVAEIRTSQGDDACMIEVQR